jgi:hypothetical protein
VTAGLGLVVLGLNWTDKMTAITSLVLTVAALAALASLGAARRSRHAQIILDISRRWDEPLATESRDIESGYLPKDLLTLMEEFYEPPAWRPPQQRADHVRRVFKLLASLNLMETIAVLYLDDAISGETIFRMWGASIVGTHDRWRAPIDLMRDREKRKGIYRNFELLADDMRERLAFEAKGNY